MDTFLDILIIVFGCSVLIYHIKKRYLTSDRINDRKIKKNNDELKIKRML